uniref:Ribosomal protein eL8/eL30/eS12/Gadd45 domain-containing protein n=1 Tax=Ailuropoda melanoleuca TaxID=9646 RepID=A0A7N5KM14_AILME
MWAGSPVGGVISWGESSRRLGLKFGPPFGEYLRGPASCAVLRASASLQSRGHRVDEIKVKATLPLRRMEASPGPWANTSQLPSPGGHPVSQIVGPEGSPESLTITRHPEASVTPRSQAPCRIELLLVGAVPCLRQEMVTAKKMKKSLESITSRLQLVMKSGKYLLRYKQTLKRIGHGKTKLVLLVNDCPALRKSQIEDCTMMPKQVSKLQWQSY